MLYTTAYILYGVLCQKKNKNILKILGHFRSLAITTVMSYDIITVVHSRQHNYNIISIHSVITVMSYDIITVMHSYRMVERAIVERWMASIALSEVFGIW